MANSAKVHIMHVYSYLRDATVPTDYQRSHGTNFNNLSPTPTAVGIILPFVPLAHLTLTVWLLKRPVSDFEGNEVRENVFSLCAIFFHFQIELFLKALCCRGDWTHMKAKPCPTSSLEGSYVYSS